jgi:hypothetical protein
LARTTECRGDTQCVVVITVPFDILSSSSSSSSSSSNHTHIHNYNARRSGRQHLICTPHIFDNVIDIIFNININTIIIIIINNNPTPL